MGGVINNRIAIAYLSKHTILGKSSAIITHSAVIEYLRIPLSI